MSAGVGQTRSFQLPWKNTDDEIAVNLAIGGLRDSLQNWLKTERGIHVETLLVSIGSLAGFAAQTAAFERVAKRDIPFPPGADTAISAGALSEYLHKNNLLVLANTKSGETFYFGDLINGYLVPQVTNDYSLWSFVAAAAIEAGLKPAELPDCNAMFRRAAQTVGTAEFGLPQVAQQHQPHLTPRRALDMFWPRARFILTRTDGPGPAQGRQVPPAYWALVVDLVARQFVLMTKDALDPRIGVTLLMESAITMSKVDPKTVPQTVPVA
jgi:hypothetical protein